MRFTAKQIAKELGVSEAAVSLALNNKPGVSDQLRKRVYAYAEELRQKNDIVFNRKNRNIKVISIVSKRYRYDKENASFHTVMLMEISTIANEAGYNTMLVFVQDVNDARLKIEQSKHDQTCGFVLNASDMNDEYIQLFKDSKFPTVVCDYESDNIPMDYIYFNNQQAINLAMKHFLEMGIGMSHTSTIRNPYTTLFKDAKHIKKL